MRVLILLLFLTGSAWAGDWPDAVGGAARVVDGDTVRVRSTTVRLYGVDAPEMRGGPEGPRSRAALEDLIGGQPVSCTVLDRDRFDRLVAICRANDRDLAEAMLELGQAVTYRRFLKGGSIEARYLVAEATARKGGLGIWALPAQAVAEGFWTIRFKDTLPALTALFVLGGSIGFTVFWDWRRRRREAVEVKETFATDTKLVGLDSLLFCHQWIALQEKLGSGLLVSHLRKVWTPSSDMFEALSVRLASLEAEQRRALIRLHTDVTRLKDMLSIWGDGQGVPLGPEIVRDLNRRWEFVCNKAAEALDALNGPVTEWFDARTETPGQGSLQDALRALAKKAQTLGQPPK